MPETRRKGGGTSNSTITPSFCIFEGHCDAGTLYPGNTNLCRDLPKEVHTRFLRYLERVSASGMICLSFD